MPIGAKVVLFMLLAPKPLFQSLYPGDADRGISDTPNQFFILDLHFFGWFLYKTDLSKNSPVYHLVSDYFNFEYILL